MVLFGSYMNLTGFQVLIRKKPASLFYYFLAGLFVNETIYLILTESQAIFNDYLVGITCIVKIKSVKIKSVSSTYPILE